VKKLTPGQRNARKAIKLAAAKLIAEVDGASWLRGCVEFRADFHLCGTTHVVNGKPHSPLGYPIYRCSTVN
jgi:hypothetical protein